MKALVMYFSAGGAGCLLISLAAIAKHCLSVRKEPTAA